MIMTCIRDFHNFPPRSKGILQYYQLMTILSLSVFHFPLLLSPVFGSFDPTAPAVRCLYYQADLELWKHEAFLVRQHFAPMDPSSRSQFRGIPYLQISASIGLTVAKALGMRLLGIPHLPSRPILAFSPNRLSLVLSLLETALSRQVLSPLPSFLLMPLQLLPFHRLCLSLPLLLFCLNVLFPSLLFPLCPVRCSCTLTFWASLAFADILWWSGWSKEIKVVHHSWKLSFVQTLQTHMPKKKGWIIIFGHATVQSAIFLRDFTKWLQQGIRTKPSNRHRSL